MATDIFGFPPSLLAVILVVASLYFVFAHSPFWFPAVIAFRRRGALNRPFAFIGVVALLSYGVFVFLALAVAIPVAAFMTYISPTVEHHGLHALSPAFKAADFALQYWWLAYGPLLMLVTWFVSRFLVTRWNNLVAASNNSFKPNPLRGSA